MVAQLGSGEPIMEVRHLSTEVALDLAARLERLADARGMTNADAMRQALAEWVGQEEDRDRLTQEALASVAAGRVVADVDVAAWIDSLGTDRALPRPR